MKHVRLTNHMRDRMVAHMLGKATGDIMKALKLEENDLALEVLDHKLGKHKKAFYGLPDSLMKTGQYINVVVQGEAEADTERDQLNFYESVKGEVDRKKRRIPNGQAGYAVPSIMVDSTEGSEKTKALAGKVTEFLTRRKELKAKQTKLEGELKRTVHQFTSTKKLEAEWPEGFEACKHLFFSEKTQAPLPAIPVHEVNAMLADFPDGVAAE